MTSHPLLALSDRGLKILVIILLAGQPVSLDYIRAEYKKPLGDTTLRYALRELAQAQLITRTAARGECYIATTTTRQLILGETSPADVSLVQTNSETSQANVSNVSHRRFDAPIVVSSIGAGEQVGSGGGEVPAPDFGQPIPFGGAHGDANRLSQTIETLRQKQRKLACEYATINAKAKNDIIADDAIDPIFIFAHAYDCQKAGHKTGILIHRITHKWTPSREAMKHAAPQMFNVEALYCPQCQQIRTVELDLCESATDYTFTCGECETELLPPPKDQTP